MLSKNNEKYRQLSRKKHRQERFVRFAEGEKLVLETIGFRLES